MLGNRGCVAGMGVIAPGAVVGGIDDNRVLVEFELPQQVEDFSRAGVKLLDHIAVQASL